MWGDGSWFTRTEFPEIKPQISSTTKSFKLNLLSCFSSGMSLWTPSFCEEVKTSNFFLCHPLFFSYSLIHFIWQSIFEQIHDYSPLNKWYLLIRLEVECLFVFSWQWRSQRQIFLCSDFDHHGFNSVLFLGFGKWFIAFDDWPVSGPITHDAMYVFVITFVCLNAVLSC